MWKGQAEARPSVVGRIMEVPSSEGIPSSAVTKCPCGAQALCMVVILVACVLYSVPEALDLQARCSASHNSQRGTAGRA